MAERADELYLPNAVLLRIIKDSLPERTIVNREARSAISKAVSSFILYVTSLASAHCSNAKRKTLTADDIFAALKEMQFDHYLPMLTTFLQNCRSKAARKKLESQTTSSSEPTESLTTQPSELDVVDDMKLNSQSATISHIVPESVETDDKLVESENEIIEIDEEDGEPVQADQVKTKAEIMDVESESKDEAIVKPQDP